MEGISHFDWVRGHTFAEGMSPFDAKAHDKAVFER